jgi:hypothetical protein
METMMLKKMTYAMLVSGLLLASFGASASSPFPDQSREIDYGIRVAKADSNSPFPDQSREIDYGIRVAV